MTNAVVKSYFLNNHKFKINLQNPKHVSVKTSGIIYNKFF